MPFYKVKYRNRLGNIKEVEIKAANSTLARRKADKKYGNIISISSGYYKGK